ncbi:hypothetical protein DA075_35590 (plasmid) [Methylobacterium currus]|uniref:Uncharacterized protein n=1 Tax=Methylobacterium currus TaxID=2051553 RepID=A0A2R4WXD5_9HYPH|nr:hypothetical protein [Methylobacterium currus]AWB26195.1 hypothetical protein DA075_35590 [Methylobacterium currus]
MTRKTTPTQPAVTAVQPTPPAATQATTLTAFDPQKVLDQIAAMRGDLTLLLDKTQRTHQLVSAMGTRQVEMENIITTRLSEGLSPITVEATAATELVTKALQGLPAALTKAGDQALKAMESVSTTAREKISASADEIVIPMKAAMEEAREHMRAMENTVRGGVARVAVDTRTEIRAMAAASRAEIAAAASAAQVALTETAEAAASAYNAATEEATAAYNLSAAHVQSFEASMANLARFAPWLSSALNRRRWEANWKTCLGAVAVLCMAEIIIRGMLWAVGLGL